MSILRWLEKLMGHFGKWRSGTPASSPVSPVVLAPVNSSLPVISGTATNGQTLAVSSGAWLNSPTAYHFQWKSNGANVGADSGSYLLVQSDVGALITCVVTASNAVGSAAATSVAVGPIVDLTPVNTSAPVASGATTVGQVLSVTNGTWLHDPTSYAYQWYDGASAIPGATANNYTLASGDNGATDVHCVVTATNSGGSASVSSNSVGPVGTVNISAPTIAFPSGRVAGTSPPELLITLPGDGTARIGDYIGRTYTQGGVSHTDYLQITSDMVLTDDVDGGNANFPYGVTPVAGAFSVYCFIIAGTPGAPTSTSPNSNTLSDTLSAPNIVVTLRAYGKQTANAVAGFAIASGDKMVFIANYGVTAISATHSGGTLNFTKGTAFGSPGFMEYWYCDTAGVTNISGLSVTYSGFGDFEYTIFTLANAAAGGPTSSYGHSYNGGSPSDYSVPTDIDGNIKPTGQQAALYGIRYYEPSPAYPIWAGATDAGFQALNGDFGWSAAYQQNSTNDVTVSNINSFGPLLIGNTLWNHA